MRICYLTTTDLIVRFFLTEHIRRTSAEHDVTLVVNTADTDLLARESINAHLVQLAIKREISPITDLRTLIWLVRYFRKEKFDLVHSIAPKAGFLGMIAAWLAKTPVRLHTFQGEVWLTRRGIMRWLLRVIDRLTATVATDLLVVSASERQFLIRERIIRPDKSYVLAHGSISGVDPERFHPNPVQREIIRRELGVGSSQLLFLYLGRLKFDKGILDLVHAFRSLISEYPRLHLAFVGPDEDGLRPTIESIFEPGSDMVHFHGYTPHPEHYLAAADVLCLPSHREGFGMTIIEAAACAVPAMASRIYGIVDALEDGVTGFLHEPGDSSEIAELIRRFSANAAERVRMGELARQRVLRDFRMDDVITATIEFYKTTIARRKEYRQPGERVKRDGK